jgi:hypothetical protein
VIWSGDDVPLVFVLISPFSVVKTILFPSLGCLVHTPLVLASTRAGSYSSPCLSPGFDGAFASQLSTPHAGVPKTTQFPAMSLNGLGNFVPNVYGHPQIAIHIPMVSVGAT